MIDPLSGKTLKHLDNGLTRYAVMLTSKFIGNDLNKDDKWIKGTMVVCPNGLLPSAEFSVPEPTIARYTMFNDKQQAIEFADKIKSGEVKVYAYNCDIKYSNKILAINHPISSLYRLWDTFGTCIYFASSIVENDSERFKLTE